MKIIKKKSTSKKLLASTLILIGVAAIVTLGAYALNIGPFNDATSNQPDQASKGTSTNPVRDQDNGSSSDENVKAPVTADEPTQPVANKDATLSVSSASQVNENIVVAANGQNITPGGRCIVYMTSEVGGSAVSEYMKVKNTSSGITCTVSIPQQKFSYLGKWNFRIAYSTTSNTIIETNGSVIVE